MSELPSDKTLAKWIKQYELYKEAHNGLAEYLSYELEDRQKKIDELEKQLAERDRLISRVGNYPHCKCIEGLNYVCIYCTAREFSLEEKEGE